MDLLGIAMYDKIRKEYVAFTFCNSKAEYIRSNVEAAIAVYKNLNDLQPTIICEYDNKTGKIKPCKKEFGFNEYKMPLSKADALAPLGVDFAKEALAYEEFKKSKKEKGE